MEAYNKQFRAAEGEVMQSLQMPFPADHAEVFRTAKGTPYLREPGVVLLAMPLVNLSGMQGFIDGFDEDLGFRDYLADPTLLPPAEQIAKAAGQLCYMSLGAKRSMNEGAQTYLHHIIGSGHGSVLEHANFTFLWYGVSRSLSHELVRHRAGVAYSQVSQRYVSGKVLRFVERPEYVDDPKLHAMFEERADRGAAEYDQMSELLLARQKEGADILSGDARTDRRKKVQQTSRSLLPNETETSIIFTVNVRSARHICEMRAADSAEVEIRRAAVKTFKILKEVAPLLFSDYEIETLADGTQGIKTPWRKV